MSNDIKLTPEQQIAIEDNGGTLLVSAAAGSGKTAVLTKRALRLITDEQANVSADRLLIVTFTRAAAAELRSRISAALADKVAQDPKNVYLRRQYIMLGRASICTLDSFCQQLLKRYFSELQIPPDFNLLSTSDAFVLRENVLTEVVETMCANKAFLEFSSLYGSARNTADMKNSISLVYDYARTMPHPKKALEKICDDYKNTQPLSLTKYGKAQLAQAEKECESALKMLRSARNIIADTPEIANYAEAINADISMFEALLGYVTAGRWDDAYNYINCYEIPKFKSVKNGVCAEKDIVSDLRKKTKSIMDDIKTSVIPCTESDYEADRQRCLPMVEALAEAALMFGEKFYDAKIAEKKLEYSDFEHLTLKLLCDENNKKTSIARTVSHGFDAVMVDEYQDTNAIQELIYNALANDDASNMFFVGDVKQSIYRFRQVSPESFIAKREKFAPHNKVNYPATIILGHNFRSTPSVIAQINDIFTCLMSKEVGEVDYNSNEELHTLAQKDLPSAMQLKLIDVGKDGDCASEALIIADTICDMVKNGVTVREGDTERPCRYNDFCILIHTRKNMLPYEAELTRRGVPCYVDNNESWITSNEIAPVISMLRIINNAAQDVAMASALMSTMFAFTPEDLAQLRLANKNGTLYSALLHSTDEKCVGFCNTLSHLRVLAATETIENVCNELFAKTHYLASLSAMENGDERRESLMSFMAFVRDTEQNISGGLSAFLRIIDSLIENEKTPPSDTVVHPKDGVSIMTIHGSKGLEYPIVILSETSHRFHGDDARQKLFFHSQLGMGFKLRVENGNLYSTVQKNAVTCASKSESTSEEMRVLYVALTRARDRLIVSCSAKKMYDKIKNIATMLLGTGGADKYVLSTATSYADWIITAALLHPDCANLRDAVDVRDLPLYAANGHIEAEIISATQQPDEVEEKLFEREAQPDNELVKRLEAGFEIHPPLEALSTLPTKLSVSQLSHRKSTRILARPDFMYKEGLTGAEMGTAQHEFMQFADFEKGGQDISAEIDRLVSENYISADIAEKLPKEALSQFLSSPLVKRMLAADKMLREYDFITAVPAKFVDANMPKDLENTPVYVQGIADAVIINGDEAEIVDYKTDKQKTEQYFIDSYKEQLRLYKAAIEKRLGLKVKACTIYSLAMQEEICII